MAVTDEEIIQDLRRVVNKIGKSPSYDEYQQHGEYSPRTVEDRFGTWNKGKEAAGIQKLQRIDIPDSELIEDIKRVASIVGGAPVIEDYKEYGQFAWRTYSNRFGKWNDGVRAAGYTPQKLDDIPEENLLDDLERVAEIVGGAPTEREYNELGEYHWRTYVNRFGSWSKAHEEIGREEGVIERVTHQRAG